MKPVYKYLSPIGVIFATIHVVAFGAPGWYKLFKPEYHNGQMSITFMSSMFPMSILTVWFFMKFFSTPMPKKLLRNSFVQLAEERYKHAVHRSPITRVAIPAKRPTFCRCWRHYRARATS